VLFFAQWPPSASRRPHIGRTSASVFYSIGRNFKY